MYQIDNASANSIKPDRSVPGPKPGAFFDDTTQTIVPADFLNAVQGELINLLVAANIDPDKADDTQIKAALDVLYIRTAAEIKATYEGNSNTNAFTDALLSKLNGVESGATADQTAAQILTLVRSVDGSGSDLHADLLDGQHGSYYLSASNLNTGTLPGARFNNTSHGVRNGSTNHSPASSYINGFMTVAQYNKLNSIDDNADVTATETSNFLFNAVGSYAMLRVVGAVGAGSPGGIETGANLRFSSADGTTSATGVSGSWRRMGYTSLVTAAEQVSLFLRVA